MLNKITAVTVLSCVVSALAFVKPVSAKITVELEEPDWQFVLRQHHRDDHRERISVKESYQAHSGRLASRQLFKRCQRICNPGHFSG